MKTKERKTSIGKEILKSLDDSFRTIVPFVMVSFLLFLIPSRAQETFYSDVSAKWKFNHTSESQWSYAIGSKYRSSFYNSGKFDFNTDYLQLNAAPSFAISPNHSVSLEIRYRIKKLFDNQRIDEGRLIQQFNHKFNKLNLRGRLRVEQRFKEKFNLRNRYRLGVKFALNKNPDKLKSWFLTADTEFLWSVFPDRRPTFDQRSSLVLEKPLTSTHF